jgi:predicted dehydrogenase
VQLLVDNALAPAVTPIADRPVRCVLVGGGKISAEHLTSLMTIRDAEVVAVCDLSPTLARFTAERFGVPRWYVDHRQMLESEAADVVHILTPPATHEALVTEFLDACHHVIVEKPITLSHSAFTRLWDHATERGVRLIENHNYRFNTPVQRLQAAVAAGRLGDVEEVEVRMALDVRAGGRYADPNFPHPSHRLPAGVIHEFISHLAYLLINFMPDGTLDDCDVLRAAWRNHGGEAHFKYDDLDAWLVAGSAHGRIRFSARQWPACLSVEVRGSAGAGKAELFNPQVRIETPRSVGQHLTPMANSLSEAARLVGTSFGNLYSKVRNRSAYEGLDRFLRLTYQALRAGGEPPVAYRDMEATSRLIDALLASENQV